MRSILFSLRATGLAAVLLLAAQPGAAGEPCSSATLNGDYGFMIAGKNLTSAVDFAFVGRFAADGAEAFHGDGVATVSGKIQRLNFTGKFAVNAGCQGTASLSFRPGLVITLEFVVVDDGREVFVLVADQGTVEFGTIKRIAAAARTAADATPSVR